jgi:hypothetical protein
LINEPNWDGREFDSWLKESSRRVSWVRAVRRERGTVWLKRFWWRSKSWREERSARFEGKAPVSWFLARSKETRWGVEEPNWEGMEPVRAFLERSRKVRREKDEEGGGEEEAKSWEGIEPVILFDRRFKDRSCWKTDRSETVRVESGPVREFFDRSRYCNEEREERDKGRGPRRWLEFKSKVRRLWSRSRKSGREPESWLDSRTQLWRSVNRISEEGRGPESLSDKEMSIVFSLVRLVKIFCGKFPWRSYERREMAMTEQSRDWHCNGPKEQVIPCHAW